MANPPRDQHGPVRGSFAPVDVDRMEVWQIGLFLGLDDSAGEDALMARHAARAEGRTLRDWDEV